jgi:hypothetical protein
MKALLHPVPIACVVIAIVGAVLGSTITVVLGMVAAIATLALLSARKVQQDVGEDKTANLSPDSRILIKPVKRLVQEIEKIIDDNAASETIRIVGVEAREEAARLLAQVAGSLALRDDLNKSLRGRYQAEKEMGEARMKMEFATEGEKTSLQTAIDARTLELKHYDQIKGHVRQIDVAVTQAEAALAEMKARLSLSASSEKAAMESGDELRETIGRMRSLNESYDEAEQLIRGT